MEVASVRFIGVATLAITVLSCSAATAQNSLSDNYRNLSCLQLEQEGRAISKRGFMLSGLEAGAGGVDGSKTAPSVVILWPSTPDHNRTPSDNLALALRQMEALEQASIASQCSIRFQRSSGS
jgi:hypothetical protein